MFELRPFIYTFNDQNEKKKIFSRSSLTFQANDSILICGPSGGGKSTFLKILKGIIPEFSSGVLTGTLLYQGHPLTGDYFQKNQKKILYLFQNPYSQLIFPYAEEEFFFSMENMNFSIEQMNAQKKNFEESFNLNDVWEKKTSQLSHGECQKLVFASLLAVEPEVLLLDEPTAFIDPVARKEFYHYLNRIRRNKMLIIVDHHIKEVLPLVNRVIEISRDGEVCEIDFEQASTRADTDSIMENLAWPSLQKSEFQLNSVKIENLNFSYGKQSIIKNVTNIFHKNEIIVITGKNGAGKSTLFKLMAGILKPLNGAVTYVHSDGKETKANSSFTNFIFQNPETHFYFDTIKEELGHSFKNIRPDQRELLIRYFFHNIDLMKSPFLLSEGEKRRLSILISAFSGKSLFFYDEPTFGQDARSKKQIARLMKSLKDQDAIQIVISHDEEFIKDVADRHFELKEGHLIEV